MMLAIKPNTQMVTHSSTVIRTPSQSNLHLKNTAVPKIDLVLFDWREHALSCESFFSVPTAKQFILKTTKNNSAYVFLIIVPADSPSLSLLFSVLFLVAPRIPHVRVCHFLSSFLPPLSSLWLCCSPRERLAPQHHLYSGRSHKGEMGTAKGR